MKLKSINPLLPANKKRNVYYMSRVVRGPDFCICEKKDADQLRGNHEADRRLCFRYADSTIPLLPKSEVSGLWLSSVAVRTGLCRRPRGPVFSERGSCVHDVFKIIKACLYCLMPKDFRELITTLHYSTQCPYTLALGHGADKGHSLERKEPPALQTCFFISCP